MLEPISAIVLAGGKSTRMGRDKTQIHLNSGLSLVDQAVARMRDTANEVIVATAGVQWDVPGVRWAFDIYEGAGPLGGIYAGLREAAWSHALVVACDMPFLNEALLRYMVGLPRDYDVLIPSLPHGVEPLHAIYGKGCLEPSRQLLEEQRYSILELFDMVRMRYLTQAEVEQFDPECRSFFNINTPDQLREARRMASAVEGNHAGH
jgi:molybdopterin-guanine dinucleotide biosynthesis protein A